MRKALRFFTSRLFWTVLVIVVQFLILVYAVFWASFQAGYMYAFMTLSVVMSFVVFTRNEKPAYKTVWIFLIAVLPILGGVLYVLMANKKLGRFSRKRIGSLLSAVMQNPPESNALPVLEESRPECARISSFVKNVTTLSPWVDTSSEYFRYADSFFMDLLGEIGKAEKFIFIEYFIIGQGYWWDMILRELEERARNGVDVRVIYDDMGSINVLPSNYDRILRQKGIKAIAFNKVRLHINPRMNFRDHRKIFCIDGNICYTGGLNLADEYSNDIIRFGYWKDNAIKIKGAAVWNFTCMFIAMWDALTGEKDDIAAHAPTITVQSDGFVHPFGDNPFDRITVGEDVYMQVISSAKRYVWIMTPYLILDDAMVGTLGIAARSGVDVRILMPHIPDKKSVFEVSRSNYLPLLEAGVRIYEFLPGFLHSKMFLADDQIAVIGTTNMDYRSFYLHFELSVLFYGAGIIKDVKDDFEDTFSMSEEQTVEKCRNVGIFTKIKRYFFCLFSSAL